MRAARTSDHAFLRDPNRTPAGPHRGSHVYARGRDPARLTEAARAEHQRFSDVVRLARKRRMPQSEFAERLGEILRDVREWEIGEQLIPRAVRVRMAAILDLDPRALNAEVDPTLTALEWDLVLALRRRSPAEQEQVRDLLRRLPPPDPFAAAAEGRP